MLAAIVLQSTDGPLTSRCRTVRLRRVIVRHGQYLTGPVVLLAQASRFCRYIRGQPQLPDRGSRPSFVSCGNTRHRLPYFGRRGSFPIVAAVRVPFYCHFVRHGPLHLWVDRSRSTSAVCRCVEHNVTQHISTEHHADVSSRYVQLPDDLWHAVCASTGSSAFQFAR